MKKDIKQKMHSGEIYDPFDEELMKEQTERLELLYDFNATRPCESEKRQELLKKMFAEIGENCYIEPPFRANWAGKNIHFGNNVYSNFNLTCIDDTDIYVGDNTMMAVNVVLATATHPILPSLRLKGLQCNMPIKIGKNCWLGAGVIVLPGVTIGDNTVVGAGSLVNKDLPSNVVAVGNPCKVLREIGEKDKKYYFKNREIPPEFFD